MIWALAYISGTVDQELLLRNEYLAGGRTESSEPRSKEGYCYPTAEKSTVSRNRLPLGRNALQDVAAVTKPDALYLLGKVNVFQSEWSFH
jgi:hypothetical protein